jgi:hypothetical protein
MQTAGVYKATAEYPEFNLSAEGYGHTKQKAIQVALYRLYRAVVDNAEKVKLNV